MRKLFIIVTLFLGTLVHSNAQTAADETGAWYMYFGTFKLAEKFSLHNELQMRYYETGGNFQQMLSRIGLNYHINKNNMFTAGYGYIVTDKLFGKDTDFINQEHRIWQQYVMRGNSGRFLFNHRYRLEERFLHDNPTGLDEFNVRARYRIMVTIPLNNSKMEPGTFFLGFYDEIFMVVRDAPFDQNRLYAAAGYKLNKSLSFQAGYLNHHVGTTNFHRIQAAVFLNLDFVKIAADQIDASLKGAF